MFDEIIIPKSYLKGLLKKKDEKLFDTNHTFQTKDLDNGLGLYRLYRQRLQKRTHQGKNWKNVNVNADVKLYDIVNDVNGDDYSAEFVFSFKNGKLDKKEVLSLTLDITQEEKNKVDKMWDTEQEIFSFYRESSIKYRIFSFLERILNKATNWARKKHQLPLSLRKEAYEKSGRLKVDPKALDVYMDI